MSITEEGRADFDISLILDPRDSGIDKAKRNYVLQSIHELEAFLGNYIVALDDVCHSYGGDRRKSDTDHPVCNIDCAPVESTLDCVAEQNLPADNDH